MVANNIFYIHKSIYRRFHNFFTNIFFPLIFYQGTFQKIRTYIRDLWIKWLRTIFYKFTSQFLNKTIFFNFLSFRISNWKAVQYELALSIFHGTIYSIHFRKLIVTHNIFASLRSQWYPSRKIKPVIIKQYRQLNWIVKQLNYIMQLHRAGSLGRMVKQKLAFRCNFVGDPFKSAWNHRTICHWWSVYIYMYIAKSS